MGIGGEPGQIGDQSEVIETDMTSGGRDTINADAENCDSGDELLVAETENKALYYSSPIQSFGHVCDSSP